MGQSRVDTMTRLAAANPPFDAKRLSNYMISIFPDWWHVVPSPCKLKCRTRNTLISSCVKIALQQQHTAIYIAPCVFRRIGIESQRSGLRRWPKHWNWTVAWWASELALRSSKGCWHPSWHGSSTLSSNERLLSQTWKMRDGTPETGLYLTIFFFHIYEN